MQLGSLKYDRRFQKQWKSQVRFQRCNRSGRHSCPMFLFFLAGKYAEFMGKETTWDNLFDSSDRPARLADLAMFQDQIFYQEALDRVPILAHIIEQSPAAEAIASLMKSKSSSFFYAHVIVKCGGANKAIPWHQDLPYWKLDGTYTCISMTYNS